jgi:hypothetical protein
MKKEIIQKLIDRVKKIQGLHNEDDQRIMELFGFLEGLLETLTPDTENK